MKKVIYIILIPIVMALSAYIYLEFKLNESISTSAPLEVNIPKNTTLLGAIDILNSEGLLEPSWLFKSYIRIRAKFDTLSLYAGYYRFEQGRRNKDILRSIFNGLDLNIVKVTIPEGLDYSRIIDIMAEKAELDKQELLRLCRSDSLLKARNIPGNSIEGYLMPDTYEIFRGQSANEVIDKLLNHQENLWDKNIQSKLSKSGYTKHEILTLASIIEAETPVDDEKSIVSGVYYNRLSRNMLLQSDPTVQYAIGEKRRLLYKDLDNNSPYNTYRYAGLPPGPINSPGLASILAAVEPTDHNYLYFVAVGDGSGKHNFATNLNQHNINKSRFKRKIRDSRRK